MLIMEKAWSGSTGSSGLPTPSFTNQSFRLHVVRSTNSELAGVFMCGQAAHLLEIDVKGQDKHR